MHLVFLFTVKTQYSNVLEIGTKKVSGTQTFAHATILKNKEVIEAADVAMVVKKATYSIFLSSFLMVKLRGQNMGLI